jgi:transcriptional regulator with XRE-family HTH domain
MTDASTLVRTAREEAGLSMRAWAERADVSFTTIFRIEHGQLDPTIGTLTKLFAALGDDLELRRRPASGPRLSDLIDAWRTDPSGQDVPDWTRFRSLLDELQRSPTVIAAAIRPKPAPSGSWFVDCLLAAIAEKVADDAGLRRPPWTRRIAPLDEPWISFGTPTTRATDVAATPTQLAERRIFIPAPALWRHDAP